LKAVIFDLDGTLINSAICFKEMKSRIIRHLESRGVIHGLLNDGMLNFEITRLAVENLRLKSFSEEHIQRILGEASEIMNEIELGSLDGATLVEGVPGTLKALKAKGLRLGIITRGCREYAERILSRFGLRKYFDAVVARDDVDRPKPDPEHARQLLKALDVAAKDALFVGDHWSDAECARRSGVEFLFVRKRGQSVDAPEAFGFPTVGDIEEIVRFIGANR